MMTATQSPDRPDRPDGTFRRIAYAGFLLWAVTFFWGPAGPYLMMPLLLAWFVYWCRVEAPCASRSPLVWMVWLFVLYVSIRAVTGYLADPSTAALQESIASDYHKIGGFWALLLAPWLTGAAGGRNRAILFGFALVGFLGEAVSSVPWGELETFVDRRGTTVADPNATATVTGFFFVLVLLIGPFVIARALRNRRPGLVAAALVLWLALLLLLGFLILATQSRSTWLALTIVVICAVPVVLWRALHHLSSQRWRTGFAVGLLGFMIVAVGAASQTETVQKRITDEKGTIDKLVSLEFSSLDPGSISNRIWLYQYGASVIPERPVFGYSPGGVESLVWKSKNEHIRHYGHFHNLYMDIAAGLGLVGFALFFGMVGISVIEVLAALLRGRLPFEWATFWLGATAFVGIDMLFDTRLFIYDYGAVMALLGSLGLGCHLERMRIACRAGSDGR